MDCTFSDIGFWTIFVIVVLALFDAVLKVISMWHSARNNHLAWFVCLAIFNTVGILPLVYLYLNRKNRRSQARLNVE